MFGKDRHEHHSELVLVAKVRWELLRKRGLTVRAIIVLDMFKPSFNVGC